MKESSSKIIGKNAENLAQDYLHQQGLDFITANYKCKSGEIDLIMQDCDTLVFIEVKYRKACNYGNGVDTVTKAKQRKIIRTASYYLITNNLFDKVPCRFDVIAFSGNANSEIQWIKDAFWTKW